MKKFISLSLAIIMIISLFSALSITSVSAEGTANQTIWKFTNQEAFGGYYYKSDVKGYLSNDCIVVPGTTSGSSYGTLRIDNLAKGTYIVSVYVKNDGVDGTNKKMNLNINLGTDSTAYTQKVGFAINSSIGDWEQVSLMVNVEEGQTLKFGGWRSANSDGGTLYLDGFKVQKVETIDITNSGLASQSASGGYLGDRKVSNTVSVASQNTFWTKGVFNLEPLTDYTVYYAAKGNCNGNIKFRTFNGTDSDEKKAVSTVGGAVNTGTQWKVISVDISTGLTGLVTMQIWRGKTSDTDLSFDLSSIAFVKKTDNPYSFIQNSVIASDSGKDKVSIVSDGYVTDTAIKVPSGTLNVNFGKWFNYVDNGLYLLTAYAKSENLTIKFKGHDGNWATTEYGASQTISGNEWTQIKVEVSVTNGQITAGFWFGTLANELYLDGFQLQKMDYINIVNPNNYWSRTPTRYDSYCSKGFTINVSGGYSEEITQYYDGSALVDLQPNTTYIMTLSYSSWYTGTETENIPVIKADTYVQTYNEGCEKDDYCGRAKYAFETSGKGLYRTATIKFTTGTAGKIVLGFWHGDAAYTINMEGHSICKANTNEYYKQIKEADIDETGAYLTDKTESGFVEKNEIRALVLGDANGDYKTDILDLVRLKNYCADTTTEISLKSCRFDEEKGAEIVIAAEDIITFRKILLSA